MPKATTEQEAAVAYQKMGALLEQYYYEKEIA